MTHRVYTRAWLTNQSEKLLYRASASMKNRVSQHTVMVWIMVPGFATFHHSISLLTQAGWLFAGEDVTQIWFQQCKIFLLTDTLHPIHCQKDQTEHRCLTPKKNSLIWVPLAEWGLGSRVVFQWTDYYSRKYNNIICANTFVIRVIEQDRQGNSVPWHQCSFQK